VWGTASPRRVIWDGDAAGQGCPLADGSELEIGSPRVPTAMGDSRATERRDGLIEGPGIAGERRSRGSRPGSATIIGHGPATYPTFGPSLNNPDYQPLGSPPRNERAALDPRQ